MDEASAIDLADARRPDRALSPWTMSAAAAMIVDPDDNRRGPFSFGLSLPYHTAYQTDFLRQTRDAVTRARGCAAPATMSTTRRFPGTRPGGNTGPTNWTRQPPNSAAAGSLPNRDDLRRVALQRLCPGRRLCAPVRRRQAGRHRARPARTATCRARMGTAADPAFNPVYRDCQTTAACRNTSWSGGNTWMPRTPAKSGLAPERCSETAST